MKVDIILEKHYDLKRALALAALMATLPGPASAQVYIIPPPLTGEPVTGAEPDLGRLMPGATPAESSAALVWNLRAGINVAALVCSRFAFLDTANNYNDFLRDHRAELASSYRSVTGYFVRIGGARAGLKALYDYDTKSYNGWSSVYGQRSFCNQASALGKQLRFVKVGTVVAFARANMRAFRNSLIPISDPLLAPPGLYVLLPRLDYPPSCYDRRGALKTRCLG